jgi:hypothetical protein
MMQVTALHFPDRTKFSEYLVVHNGLRERGFQEWVFSPGMLFNATERWWGMGGSRKRPHEGLDLCLYRVRGGATHSLDEAVKIPVLFDGVVVRVIDDYIGKSIFIRHYLYDEKGDQLFSVYGHTRPCDHVRRGRKVKEGNVIATISTRGDHPAHIMPHLHISIAWIPQKLYWRKRDWDVLSNSYLVTLVNPLEVLECRYSISNLT